MATHRRNWGCRLGAVGSHGRAVCRTLSELSLSSPGNKLQPRLAGRSQASSSGAQAGPGRPPRQLRREGEVCPPAGPEGTRNCTEGCPVPVPPHGGPSGGGVDGNRRAARADEAAEGRPVGAGGRRRHAHLEIRGAVPRKVQQTSALHPAASHAGIYPRGSAQKDQDRHSQSPFPHWQSWKQASWPPRGTGSTHRGQGFQGATRPCRRRSWEYSLHKENEPVSITEVRLSWRRHNPPLGMERRSVVAWGWGR